MSIMQWIIAHMGWLGFALSELLVLVPSIKSNSVIQLVCNLVQSLSSALSQAFGAALPPAPKV